MRPFVRHPDHARAVTRNIIDNLAELEGRPASEYLSVYSAPQGWEDAYQAAARALGDIRYQHNPGRMYEVNLHARPEQFLDWDAPMAQQGKAIQAIYNRHIAPRLNTRQVGEHLTDVRIDQGAIGAFPNAQVPDVMANPAAHVPTRGSDFYDGLARTSINGDWGAPGEFAREQATRALADLNIPGIRYLDQGSRGAGEGTRNYVVFNPEIIEILRRYGMAGPVSAATLLSQYESPPEQ